MATSNPWAQIATYCANLAPVAGPLIAAIGETATAVDRAQRQCEALPGVATPGGGLGAALPPEDDFADVSDEDLFDD